MNLDYRTRVFSQDNPPYSKTPCLLACPKCHGETNEIWKTDRKDGKPRFRPLFITVVCKNCAYDISLSGQQ